MYMYRHLLQEAVLPAVHASQLILLLGRAVLGQQIRYYLLQCFYRLHKFCIYTNTVILDSQKAMHLPADVEIIIKADVMATICLTSEPDQATWHLLSVDSHMLQLTVKS